MTFANWPEPPVCFLWVNSCFSTVLVMVSRYATCGLPTLASTLNSRRMRSTRMSRWSSPIPPMTVWPVSSSSSTEKVGSSSASFWIAMPSFSWSDLVFGSMETWMTGSGERHRLEDDRVRLIAQGVTGGGVLEADHRVDVAGHGLVDRVLLVGVHLEELADALLLALGGVEHLGARIDTTRVDADEGQLAEERVRRDLERESRERLFLARLTSEDLFLVVRACDPTTSPMSSGFGR